MLPRASMTTPEPVPRCGPGDGSGIPGPNWKKRRKNGDVSSSSSPRPCAARGRSTSTSMRTTDGRNAFAVAENADDSTRASFGASVLGVTGPPGASAGAGAACFVVGPDAAVPPDGACCMSPELGPDPPRRHPGEAATITTATATATLTRRYLARSDDRHHPGPSSSPIRYRR